MITQQGLELDLQIRTECVSWDPSEPLSKMGSIDLDLQGHFSSNVYIVISQERVDRLTSDENHLDR